MNGPKIMVVDDNPATRRMVRNALARNGHDVLEASDGRSALELMRREQPRVVLQDLVLPDIDGFELVGQLREASPQCTVLAFSGFVSKLSDARISSVGFDDIIPKPIAPSRLVPLVEAHLPAPLPADERFGSGRRLIVVDDDPLQLKLAQFRLSRLGFEVVIATDGATALEEIRRRPPDAVVSDVMMPNLDGFGLAMALRGDPATCGVPLLLVTSSYIEPSDRELAQRSGANDLVVRTSDLGELIALLRQTLDSDARPRVVVTEAFGELERDRNRRVVRQLERQVMLNTGLAKRCSVLSSELTVLAGIADAVLKHRDVDSALDEAIATCFDAGGISVGALYLLDPGGALRVRTLTGEGTWNAADLATFFGREALLRHAIRDGRTLHVPSPEVPGDVSAELLARCEASALQLVPLGASTTPVGALLMVARSRDLDADDWRAFGVGLATQIGQALTLANVYAEREAAEKRAAEHAAVLEALVDSAPDAILHVATDGKILFANRGVLGVRSPELVGRSVFDLPRAPETNAIVREEFERVVRTGAPGSYEAQGPTRDGHPGWFSVRLGPVKQNGRVVAVVLSARDITDTKRTEMQLMLSDRMASVGTLAAGVAHEINNPLASVIANIDLVAQEVDGLAKRVSLPKDLREELHDARTSADRVRVIVRDLKIFSRGEDDSHGAVDIKHVLESTLRMAWNELRHRARVVKEYGEVPLVDGNESRLGQVFLNLIVNAAHAIPLGNFERNQLRITTAKRGDRVLIAIADTGCGIPDDIKPRLFTPFFTTKPVGVGTGLGLAIAHRIVTGLGGTIEFESQVGHGSEFRVVLPIAGEQERPFAVDSPAGQPAVRRGEVLVIDDEPALVLAIQRCLAMDHEVHGVTSAGDALDLIASGKHFDVILCDVMMPQLTGMDFYARIVERAPELARKIVFVTGGAFTPSARQFLDRVPNRRIDKPFDLQVLRTLVNDLVG